MQYARKQHAATADGSPAEVAALSYSSRTSLKMCRYGKGCTRKDCKFRHEGDFARYVFCGQRCLEFYGYDTCVDLYTRSERSFRGYMVMCRPAVW